MDFEFIVFILGIEGRRDVFWGVNGDFDGFVKRELVGGYVVVVVNGVNGMDVECNVFSDGCVIGLGMMLYWEFFVDFEYILFG